MDAFAFAATITTSNISSSSSSSPSSRPCSSGTTTTASPSGLPVARGGCRRPLVMDNGEYNRQSRRWECTVTTVKCRCAQCKAVPWGRCGHTFKNKLELKAHHSTGHSFDVGEVLACSHGCVDSNGRPKRFQNKSNLRRHVQLEHAGGKAGTLKCPVGSCTATQTRGDNLERHLKTVHHLDTVEAKEAVRCAKRQRASTGAPLQANQSDLEDFSAATAAANTGLGLGWVEDNWSVGDWQAGDNPVDPMFELDGNSLAFINALSTYEPQVPSPFDLGLTIDPRLLSAPPTMEQMYDSNAWGDLLTAQTTSAGDGLPPGYAWAEDVQAAFGMPTA